MEVKKNMNNQQRKMLDEIYKEQFEKRARAIKGEREQGLKKLQDKCLKEQLKDKDLKKFIEAGQLYYKLQEELADKLRSRGLTISSKLHGKPELGINSGYYNAYELPEIEAYNDETIRIESRLSEKKREMRAKIYGVSASYEEVDAEIQELLKDI